MSELYFVACVLIRYLTSVFVLRKGLHIPHWKHCLGWRMVPRVTERRVTHNNNTLLLSSCSSVPLFIWHCVGGLPVWGVVLWGEDEELEKVGVVGEEEEGARVRLYSPAHSRPVVHERISPENSSCSALWQDPPDCSLHKKPQLPEHYWFKERAREQTAWAPCPPPTPSTHTDLPSLSFSLSLVPKLHPKTMHTTHQSKVGRRLLGNGCV